VEATLEAEEVHISHPEEDPILEVEEAARNGVEQP
jgi:hypothetical protein